MFRTDDFLTVDFAVIRNIDIVRNHRAQVRLEIYDLFNNYYAVAPALSLANLSTFGKISNVAGNRSIQLAFKYNF